MSFAVIIVVTLIIMTIIVMIEDSN